jgi:PIN domain nuclease of toxin-antitoxin system
MILLDTHVMVWLASDPEKLSPRARNLIERHAGALHISVVSAWEIALLEKRHRLTLPMGAEDYVARVIDFHGLIELPLVRQVVHRAVRLPDVHDDPFDRILVAECLERRLTLVSRDTALTRYPDLRIAW